jgi:hypothetical protein
MESVDCTQDPRFSYLHTKQDIVVIVSGTKPVITPTYLTKIEPLKIADNVNESVLLKF